MEAIGDIFGAIWDIGEYIFVMFFMACTAPLLWFMFVMDWIFEIAPNQEHKLETNVFSAFHVWLFVQDNSDIPFKKIAWLNNLRAIIFYIGSIVWAWLILSLSWSFLTHSNQIKQAQRFEKKSIDELEAELERERKKTDLQTKINAEKTVRDSLRKAAPKE